MPNDPKDPLWFQFLKVFHAQSGGAALDVNTAKRCLAIFVPYKHYLRRIDYGFENITEGATIADTMVMTLYSAENDVDNDDSPTLASSDAATEYTVTLTDSANKYHIVTGVRPIVARRKVLHGPTIYIMSILGVGVGDTVLNPVMTLAVEPVPYAR